ncbi:glyoxalase [Nocardioides marmoriginsengisoli]|uniref:Glyoxalase n=1 Tax=Nocardioides marmoriginsengisoli TaxID=661483 RepID=A0A3N0CAS0_9ACTN|nr:glyoxalase [Nocardioides marmoriginsengisoli]RNL60550.1 glyoxalase [Nocardioides marmoriginsengisoli]
MATITSLALEASDPAAATAFQTALGVERIATTRPESGPSAGFRGYTISLVVSQPGNVDALMAAALGAGGTVLKPAKKGLWGYGGVVQAPDGSIWKLATSSKKDTVPATKEYDDVVLLLGVEDVKATKQFYADRGFEVGKAYGGKYVEFVSAPGSVKLALYKHGALAKDAGVPADGSGSHRIVLSADAGTFSDPDGFSWESTQP